MENSRLGSKRDNSKVTNQLLAGSGLSVPFLKAVSCVSLSSFLAFCALVSLKDLLHHDSAMPRFHLKNRIPCGAGLPQLALSYPYFLECGIDFVKKELLVDCLLR